MSDVNKVDGDNAENLGSITTSPNFQAADATEVLLVDQGSGNWQFRIFTSKVAGFEYKGLYVECNVQRLGVNVAGDTGYTANAYGISTPASSHKRYMGPLHIKVHGEKCGWDPLQGEILNEALSATTNEIDIVLQNGGSPGGVATF